MHDVRIGSMAKAVRQAHAFLYGLAALLVLSLVFGAGIAHAQGAWELGNYQLLRGHPSGPLRAKMLGPSSLASFSFVGAVGGVAFAETAVPGPIMKQAAEIGLRYEPSRADGSRLAVSVGQTLHWQELPDWLLVPIAAYADSEYNACVSLFGENTTEDHYDIVYHPAFQDQLLGLRLLQADILLFDLRETWNLPRFGSRVVLGSGELQPAKLDMTSLLGIQGALDNAAFQSWVLTDSGETIQVDIKGGRLEFVGEPYYYFWRIEDQEGFQSTRNRLVAEAEALRSQGKIFEHNELVDRINHMTPAVAEVESITRNLKAHRDDLRRFNPAVYDAATSTARYAAFFRFLKQQNPDGWSRFVAALRLAQVRPEIVTPTRWRRPQ